MTVYAAKKNGDEIQIKVKGDQQKIAKFIELYTGSDLGNDLILQPFVDDFEETGVVIHKN